MPEHPQQQESEEVTAERLRELWMDPNATDLVHTERWTTVVFIDGRAFRARTDDVLQAQAEAQRAEAVRGMMW